MKKLISKYKMVIVAVIIAIAGIFYVNKDNKYKPANDNITRSTFAGEICVYVSGAVSVPGVYKADANTRLSDVIDMAGGFNDDAYIGNLNLASYVYDTQKIYIMTISEKEAMNDSGLVNINEADINRLTTLPGIGEVRAQAIIDYRNEHGRYDKIEDIMNVAGIKEASYEKIKDYIVVD